MNARKVYNLAYRNYRRWSSGEEPTEQGFQAKRDRLEIMDHYSAGAAWRTWQTSDNKFSGKPGYDYGSYVPQHFCGLAKLQTTEQRVADEIAREGQYANLTTREAEAVLEILSILYEPLIYED